MTSVPSQSLSLTSTHSLSVVQAATTMTLNVYQVVEASMHVLTNSSRVHARMAGLDVTLQLPGKTCSSSIDPSDGLQRCCYPIVQHLQPLPRRLANTEPLFTSRFSERG